MSAFASPSSEVETAVMSHWWSRNCKPFSEWFLQLTAEERLVLLQKGCPDIPKITSATRAQRGEQLLATDMLLPEIAEDALMASGGKLCVLFITRRMISPGLCVPADLKMLRNLAAIKQLPIFNTGNAVKAMDTPFIDPADQEENVQCLTSATSTETRKEVMENLANGRFATVEVWMALKVRRTAIARFIRVLFEEFESKCDALWKPNPTLIQLISGELQMQAADAEQIKKDASSNLEQLS